MMNIKQFDVLNGCRTILKFTNLYNTNGFYIGAYRIPDFLVYSLLVLPMICEVILEIWFCFDENFNLETTSNTMQMAIGATQMASVYISLASKTDSIVEIIDHLQKVVTESNEFFQLNFNSKMNS